MTVQGIRIPFANLLSLHYVGLFANNFLPSGIGGDALRICPFRKDTIIGRWLSQMGKYKAAPGVLIKVLALSFLFQALMILAKIFIFRSAGINLPLAVHFLYIPVIMAVSMLPISINGLGIREGMYIILYGYAGVDSATAVLCSLLFFILVTLASLAGGIAFLQRKW